MGGRDPLCANTSETDETDGTAVRRSLKWTVRGPIRFSLFGGPGLGSECLLHRDNQGDPLLASRASALRSQPRR